MNIMNMSVRVAMAISATAIAVTIVLVIIVGFKMGSFSPIESTEYELAIQQDENIALYSFKPGDITNFGQLENGTVYQLIEDGTLKTGMYMKMFGGNAMPVYFDEEASKWRGDGDSFDIIVKMKDAARVQVVDPPDW